jgi:hypothetical protein
MLLLLAVTTRIARPLLLLLLAAITLGPTAARLRRSSCTTT